MDSEILENHKSYLERKKRYKGFGYDIDKERSFVLEQAKPLYGKILEAGTGKGYFALTLAKQGYSFVSFDISQEELCFAKLNLVYYGVDKNVCLKVEDAERTSFADASFDVIFSINTLHHLRNPFQVIDELTRLLSQKGKLILSDFTKEGFEIMDKVHALEGKTHEVSKTTLLDIESYLAKKGFAIKRRESVPKCPYSRKGAYVRPMVRISTKGGSSDIYKITRNPLLLEIRPSSQVLRQVTCPVEAFDNDIQLLADQMLDFMRKNGGIGLAAPQIGLSRRIIVIGAINQSICVVNPKITLAPDWDWMKEGCLSLPGKIINIKRHKNLQVQGFDITGKSVSMPASDLLARVFQHEIDHLNGKLICDYAVQGSDS